MVWTIKVNGRECFTVESLGSLARLAAPLMAGNDTVEFEPALPPEWQELVNAMICSQIQLEVA